MNWDVWPFHGAVARWFLDLPVWAQLLVAWPIAAALLVPVWVRIKRPLHVNLDDLDHVARSYDAVTKDGSR